MLLSFGILTVLAQHVNALYFSTVFDYVVEGEDCRKIIIHSTKTDPQISDITFKPITGTTKIDVKPTVYGFELCAPDNDVEDPNQRYTIGAFDNNTGILLNETSFLMIDNDGVSLELIEHDCSIPFQIQHKASGKYTEYKLLSRFPSQSLTSDWDVVPSKVTFEPTESGNKTLLIRPKDDTEVEGPEKFIIVASKQIDGFISVYHSKAITILDNDVRGTWSEWTDGECQFLGFRCMKSRRRECLPPKDLPLERSVRCTGDFVESIQCTCP